MKLKVLKKKLGIVAGIVALGTLVVIGSTDRVHAVVTNTLPGGVTVLPATFIEVRSSDQSNVDVGPQNPANVEAVLESSVWFDQPLTFVGGGACGVSPNFQNGCTAFDVNGNKGGSSNLEGNVFGVHYGNAFIAVLYSGSISNFSIEGLVNGVSNIYAFNTVSQVPLPAAFPLFFSALALLGLGSWFRRKRGTATV